jgi:hypothetical protein
MDEDEEMENDDEILQERGSDSDESDIDELEGIQAQLNPTRGKSLLN